MEFDAKILQKLFLLLNAKGTPGVSTPETDSLKPLCLLIVNYSEINRHSKGDVKWKSDS